MACHSLLELASSAYIKVMSTDQIMQIAYLGLLAAAIGGSYIFANKDNLGKVAQQAAIWGMIFLGTIAAIGLWNDVSRDVMPRQAVVGEQIVLPRGNNGHYHMTVQINGAPVDFLVDTGASQVVLTQSDAKKIGFDLDDLQYLGIANTANGQVRTAPVTLNEVVVGPYVDRNLRATVNGGQMDKSLLGMTYLGLYDSISITNDELILSR